VNSKIKEIVELCKEWEVTVNSLPEDQLPFILLSDDYYRALFEVVGVEIGEENYDYDMQVIEAVTEWVGENEQVYVDLYNELNGGSDGQ